MPHPGVSADQWIYSDVVSELCSRVAAQRRSGDLREARAAGLSQRGPPTPGEVNPRLRPHSDAEAEEDPMASTDPVPAEPDTGSPASAAYADNRRGCSQCRGRRSSYWCGRTFPSWYWRGCSASSSSSRAFSSSSRRSGATTGRRHACCSDWPVPSRSSSGCSACAGRCRQRCCSGCSSGRRGSSPASSASCTRSVRGMATAADGGSLPGS